MVPVIDVQAFGRSGVQGRAGNSLPARLNARTPDQLHRAQRGIDTRLLRTVECLLPIGADVIAAVGLLLYVGSAHWLFPLLLVAGLCPLAAVRARNMRRRYELDRKQTASVRMLRY